MFLQLQLGFFIMNTKFLYKTFFNTPELENVIKNISSSIKVDKIVNIWWHFIKILITESEDGKSWK